MEAYITSIHMNQLKCTIQHYWFQLYSCLFWVASTLFIHNWEIKEKQLELLLMKNKLSHHDVFTTTATATTIETIIEEEEEDDNYCFSEEGEEEEEEESDSDDETVVTTTLTPWTKEYETQTLHSFDTSKSESKSNIKRKMSHIKHQMTAWRQKHFSKKKQNLLATFRRKT